MEQYILKTEFFVKSPCLFLPPIRFAVETSALIPDFFHFWTSCPKVLLMVYGVHIQLFSIPYMLISFPLTTP